MEQSPPSPQPEPEDQEPETDPLAEARQLIADHEKQRMQACHDEIAAVLDKYGMSLVVEPGRAVLIPKT